MQPPEINRNRVATLVAIIAVTATVGIIVWGFAKQLALARQMRDEENRLAQAVATERARHKDLVAQLEYVQSDAYVEKWARTEARMTKSGEVVIVLVDEAEEEPAAETKAPPPSEPEKQPFWAELWELVFAPRANGSN
jgi:cell division protein FtsB